MLEDERPTRVAVRLGLSFDDMSLRPYKKTMLTFVLQQFDANIPLNPFFETPKNPNPKFKIFLKQLKFPDKK